jgi:hypothetical protein
LTRKCPRLAVAASASAKSPQAMVVVHSTAPLPWSGSIRKTISIQSGISAVEVAMTANTAAMSH